MGSTNARYEFLKSEFREGEQGYVYQMVKNRFPEWEITDVQPYCKNFYLDYDGYSRDGNGNKTGLVNMFFGTWHNSDHNYNPFLGFPTEYPNNDASETDVVLGTYNGSGWDEAQRHLVARLNVGSPNLDNVSQYRGVLFYGWLITAQFPPKTAPIPPLAPFSVMMQRNSLESLGFFGMTTGNSNPNVISSTGGSCVWNNGTGSFDCTPVGVIPMNIRISFDSENMPGDGTNNYVPTAFQMNAVTVQSFNGIKNVVSVTDLGGGRNRVVVDLTVLSINSTFQYFNAMDLTIKNNAAAPDVISFDDWKFYDGIDNTGGIITQASGGVPLPVGGNFLSMVNTFILFPKSGHCVPYIGYSAASTIYGDFGVFIGQVGNIVSGAFSVAPVGTKNIGLIAAACSSDYQSTALVLSIEKPAPLAPFVLNLQTNSRTSVPLFSMTVLGQSPVVVSSVNCGAVLDVSGGFINVTPLSLLPCSVRFTFKVTNGYGTGANDYIPTNVQMGNVSSVIGGSPAVNSVVDNGDGTSTVDVTVSGMTGNTDYRAILFMVLKMKNEAGVGDTVLYQSFRVADGVTYAGNPLIDFVDALGVGQGSTTDSAMRTWILFPQVGSFAVIAYSAGVAGNNDNCAVRGVAGNIITAVNVGTGSGLASIGDVSGAFDANIFYGLSEADLGNFIA